MDRTEELAALAWEAHRRAITYGKLVGGLTCGELDKITRHYRNKMEYGKEVKKRCRKGQSVDSSKSSA